MGRHSQEATLEQRPRFTRGQVFALSVAAFLVVFGLVPRAIGRRGRRFGWSTGRPGFLNRLGAVPLTLGAAGWAWCIANHYEPSGTVPASLVPESLIVSGPYKHSRNPIYISEEALLVGWALYFGSPVLFTLCAAFPVAARYAVGREEQTLQTRFGDAWREYACKVPRWL
jgi:protein-S-isoprenylcysteine O-methyltransferase Ste14